MVAVGKFVVIHPTKLIKANYTLVSLQPCIFIILALSPNYDETARKNKGFPNCFMFHLSQKHNSPSSDVLIPNLFQRMGKLPHLGQVSKNGRGEVGDLFFFQF